ncbi:MAG: DUF4329 domain-containing protein, partial [Flavobacteriales bacterium]|nr:DUF4329 domain-containing protein [Flavobacteriales bacterium]
NSNRLIKVTDAESNSKGFNDGHTGVYPDFVYDSFGNMIEDKNKGITNITYNHLNLPVQVDFGTQGNITYLYSADGIKLQKAVTEGSNTTTIEYRDGFQYQDEDGPGSGPAQLDFFPHAEGTVEVTHSSGGGIPSYNYVFHYLDHLGNIRVRYALDPDPNDNQVKILEESHYYPFGLKHEGYNNSQKGFNISGGFIVLTPVDPLFGSSYKYGFQGQEEQTEFDLGWQSFKYRNYDPAIGRFMNIDPLTEDYMDWGPYVFSGNRVIDARELEGLEPHSVHKSLDDAATNFAEQYNGISIRSSREAGTRFYSTTNSSGETIYSYTTPVLGGAGLVDVNDSEGLDDGQVQVATGHTHGADRNIEVSGVENSIRTGDNFPSSEDLDKADKLNQTSYQVSPNGTLNKYTPQGSEGQDREDDVVTVTTAKNIPSDSNSNTRVNEVSANVTPEVLPVNVEKDDFPKN